MLNGARVFCTVTFCVTVTSRCHNLMCYSSDYPETDNAHIFILSIHSPLPNLCWTEG